MEAASVVVIIMLLGPSMNLYNEHIGHLSFCVGTSFRVKSLETSFVEKSTNLLMFLIFVKEIEC